MLKSMRTLTVYVFSLLTPLMGEEAPRIQGLWEGAVPLQDMVGKGFEWDSWNPQNLEGWQYYENFGAFYPWADWIYHLDHGWLFPVGEDLTHLWLYSLKLNKNWIWTSNSHFDFFYIYKSGGFFFYDASSKGELFHDFQTGEWILWYELPELFPMDSSWEFEPVPAAMTLIPQGEFYMGGVTPGESFTDQDGDDEYDEGEPFEDSDGNGQWDARVGYDDEYPRHRVELSPFYIRQVEVTNELWVSVHDWATTRPDKTESDRAGFLYRFDSMEYVNYAQIIVAYGKLETAYNNYQQNPSESNEAAFNKANEKWDRTLEGQAAKVAEIEQYRLDYPDRPVNNVSWSDAVKWCNALSEMEGRTPVYHVDRGVAGVYRTSQRDDIASLENGFVKWYADGYRLPTEAEWEKAARGGWDNKQFPTGDTINSGLSNMGNSYHNGGGPQNVGSYPPNPYGVYDMAGNLQEWCWDWKSDYNAVGGSFTLKASVGGQTANIVLETLSGLETVDGIVSGIQSALDESPFAGRITVGQEDSRLALTLLDPADGEYLVISGVDRNATKILGLRDKDSSIPLSVVAQRAPSGAWASTAAFDVEILNLETGALQRYSITAEPPESGKVLTLFVLTNHLNKGLEVAGLGDILTVGTKGDRIMLSLERGQAPASFQLFMSEADPISSILGFSNGQQSFVGLDGASLLGWVAIQPGKAERDPHGPVDGDRRVFRGGHWEYKSFYSRTSLRSSHLPTLPSKSITFRTVIGLPWDKLR